MWNLILCITDLGRTTFERKPLDRYATQWNTAGWQNDIARSYNEKSSIFLWSVHRRLHPQPHEFTIGICPHHSIRLWQWHISVKTTLLASWKSVQHTDKSIRQTVSCSRLDGRRPFLVFSRRRNRRWTNRLLWTCLRRVLRTRWGSLLRRCPSWLNCSVMHDFPWAALPLWNISSDQLEDRASIKLS